jgi:LysM repeat protein
MHMQLFGNQKRVRLSNNLSWSVGRKLHSTTYLWIMGGTCLVLAGWITYRTVDSSVTPPIPQPQVLGATTTQGYTVPSIEFMDYQVDRGDTLFTISKQFNVPWTTLAELNDLKPPFNLRQGQIVKVPIQ